MLTGRQELTLIKCMKFAKHWLCGIVYIILLNSPSRSYVRYVLSFTEKHSEVTDKSLAEGLMTNKREAPMI